MPLPLVSPMDRMLFLKAQPYLQAQPPEVLIALASYSEERFFATGSQVRTGDAPIDRVHFLADGAVTVHDGTDPMFGGRQISAPGVVGLVHHFADVTHAPAVFATRDTLCLEIEVDDLDQIMEDHSSLLLRFAARGAEEAERALASLGPQRGPEPGYDSKRRPLTPTQLDVVARLAQARRASFFSRTSLSVVGRLIPDESIEILSAGETLWSAGDPIDRMAFIVDGSLVREVPDEGHRAPAGAVVGAREILRDGTHQETWRAKTNVRLLSILREDFIDALEDHFDYAMEYLRFCAVDTLRGWHQEPAGAPVVGGAAR